MLMSISLVPKTQLSMSTTSINQESVTLTCSVSSSGWKYYWYKDKSLHKPQNPQLFSDHPFITVSSGGTYQCRGGRGDPVYYSNYSNSVVTNIPVVTLKSNWSEIFYSETVTLRCEIKDGGDTEWVYEWLTSGPELPQEQSQYLTIRVEFFSSRWYNCKGKHKVDENMETEWILLSLCMNTVIAHLTSDTTSIQQGSSVTLTCSVRSSSGWKYYWYKDNTLYKPHTTQDFSDNPQISVSVGGSYRCRGGRGNPVYYTYDSNTVSISTIVSNVAIVTLDPNWSEIYTGEKITLRCEIHRGDTEWEYEWRKSDSALSETESEIRITEAHSDHTGDYSCRGKMKQSQDRSTNWSDKVTLTVTVVSLRVSPNRSQHSTSESISLSCETNSTKWGVRQFYKNSYSYCGNYRWRTKTSPCMVSKAVANGAVFWCESGSGEFSNAVNISTHDDIILESPVHPVTEGQPLILSCRLWTDANLTDVSFYKNGKVIQTGTSGQLSISAVSKSNEGFYKCERKQVKSRRPQVWMSSESWVSVKCECT
uniref:Ig-like domain-containing protein n=1 Tax=Sphaeramia orbicularis TaxID=375764 RepID=A0A672YFC6_9TELE